MVPYTPASTSSFDVNTQSLTTPLNGGFHNKITETTLSINTDDTTCFLVDVPASFIPGDVLKITPKWAEINHETGRLLDRNLPLTPESKDMERFCDNTKEIHGEIIDKLRYNLLGHLVPLVRKYNLRCGTSF